MNILDICINMHENIMSFYKKITYYFLHNINIDRNIIGDFIHLIDIVTS